MLRSLIEEVRILPEEGDAYQIELRGELAAILALAQEAKSAVVSGQKALQIRMVAGARNPFCYMNRSRRVPAVGEIEDAHQLAA